MAEPSSKIDPREDAERGGASPLLRIPSGPSSPTVSSPGPPTRIGRSALGVPTRLALTLLVGWLAATSPLLAIALVVALLGAISLSTRVWLGVSWFLLAGLVVLSYGFNNVAFPLPGANVPLVDVLLVFALAASFPFWRDATLTPLGRRLIWLLSLMTLIALARLAVDVPHYGQTAGRDALYVLESWGVFVGYAMVRASGVERTQRMLSVLWSVALGWFLLYPLREQLAEAGPSVGIQRPTALLSFTSIGIVSAIALFWFLDDRRRGSMALSALALTLVVVAQIRGIYLAIPLALIAIWISDHRPVSRLVPALARIGCVVAIVAVLLASLPPLPGRVGEQVSVATVITQLTTLSGADGPGAGSLSHRAEAWPLVVETVRDAPAGPLFGVGYGPDLFDGFTIVGDVEVRKPHNDFLEVWARTGFLGLAPWLALLGLLAVWSFRVASRHPRGWWLIGLQSVAFMSAATQPFFGFSYGGLVYMMLMGIGLGLGGEIPTRGRSVTSQKKPRPYSSLAT